MKLLHDFSSPEYMEALATSIKNGLGIVLVMLAVGAVLTVAGGGLSARFKKESSAHHH